MLDQVAVSASKDILGALGRIGRTEDVAFSADGRRLAIAGFGQHSVIVLDLMVEDKPAAATIAISAMTEVWSHDLHNPHGVEFLGDRALVVANRAGAALIFDTPAAGVGARRVNVDPVAAVGPGTGGELVSPGSVRAAQVAPDLHEVLVCDNAASVVTRYLVDVRDGVVVLSGEVLVAHGLATPDSVAYSQDRGWLAVSNHDTHSVLLFARPEEMHQQRWADGVLENVTYPHGLVFARNGAYVVVADAGAPFLHVYARGDGDWSGNRQPVRSVRLMDDETFLRGRYNIQEGGPKGLSLDHTSEVLVATSEHQPLAFFELATVLGPDAGAAEPPADRDGEHQRATILREVRALAGARADARDRQAVADVALGRVAELEPALASSEARNDDLAARAADAAARAASELADLRERAEVAAAEAARTADTLRTALVEADKGRDLASAHVAHLEFVVADRDAQIGALRRSSSWRVTAPLRRLTALRRRRS